MHSQIACHRRELPSGERSLQPSVIISESFKLGRASMRTQAIRVNESNSAR